MASASPPSSDYYGRSSPVSEEEPNKSRAAPHRESQLGRGQGEDDEVKAHRIDEHSGDHLRVRLNDRTALARNVCSCEGVSSKDARPAENRFNTGVPKGRYLSDLLAKNCENQESDDTPV